MANLSESAYKNKIAYNNEYNKAFYRRYNICFSKVYEPEIVEWLQNKENVTEYIRELVREDMKRRG